MSIVSSSPPDKDVSDPITSELQLSAAETSPVEKAALRVSRFSAPSPALRRALKSGLWRPLLSCGGALGLGLALSHVLVKPVTPRTESNVLPEIMLARETTLVVQAQRPPGALLRGEIRLVADVMGRAPVGGAVARQLIEPGTRVERGDAVVEISSGQAARSAPRAERQQSEAERSQIQAADAQTALAQKMAGAQAKLLSAQARVERAQAQVGAARDLVRRLQNGETVASTEIPATYRSGGQPSRGSDDDSPRRASARPSLSRGALIAAQQAQAAREAAREGARDLQSARQTLSLAQTNVRETNAKLKAAATQVSEVEARFEAKKASGADVENARGTQSEAQAAVNAASKALEGAEAELSKREKSSTAMTQYAEKAQAEAAALGATPESAPSPPPTARPVQVTSTRITLDEAAKFANAALDESRRASRAADRIHSDIESYQRQVSESRTRIQSATQNLASAQQQVLDSVPRPRFTSARAPASGIVTWVSRLAREVGAGQGVFGIARGDKVAAHFEDKSGLWRNIKPGEILPALLTSQSSSSKTPVSATASATAPSATAPSATQTALAAAKSGAPKGETVAIKVTEVRSPTSEGEAALVSGEVNFSSISAPSGMGTASVQAGMEILASVAQKNEKPTLSVPLSALMQRGAVTYLAVLTPVISAQKVASTPNLPSSPDAASSAKAAEVERFQLRWQEVSTGRSDGIRQEITTGLAPGMRVVVLPAALEELGLQPAVAEDGLKMSSDLGTFNANEVVVRLTSSSA